MPIILNAMEQSNALIIPLILCSGSKLQHMEHNGISTFMKSFGLIVTLHIPQPSYLLFGMDCRCPTEAAFLPPKITNISDYTVVDLEIFRGDFRLNNCDPRLRSVYSPAGAVRIKYHSQLSQNVMMQNSTCSH